MGYLDGLTSMIERDRRSLVYFFASLEADQQLDVMRRQAAIINRRRSEMDKDRRTEFYYASLVLAAAELKAERARLKRRTATPSDLGAADEERLIYLKKRRSHSPNRDFLVRHAALLRRLRDDGLSWRLMAEYLRRYHGQKISSSYLRLVFRELSVEPIQEPSQAARNI